MSDPKPQQGASPSPSPALTDDQLSRRAILGAGAAAIAAAGAFTAAAETQAGSDTYPQNKPGGPPPTNAGPQNEALIEQNPSTWSPPYTDAGDVNNFRYPFAFGHNRVSPGAGWARQVTVRDLAISKTIAGVNMRLEPNAVRELHWHVPAEWAYMLTGNARITGVDAHNHSEVSDVGPGDLWYFPPGVPHSIQADEKGCEFLLVFDDGNFSEFATFLITDWIGHTPPEVVAKNMGWDASVVDKMHKKELYIFKAPAYKPLDQELKEAQGPAGGPPNPFNFKLKSMKPAVTTKSGEVRIADSNNFKVSKTIATALVTVKPGGLREMHWHPNADEWSYVIKGQGRMTVFIGGSKARTIDMHAGDVGYVDQSVPHYVENTGKEDLEFLEMFKSDHYEDISLVQWMSHLPTTLLAAHLKVDEKLLADLPKEKPVIAPA